MPNDYRLAFGFYTFVMASCLTVLVLIPRAVLEGFGISAGECTTLYILLVALLVVYVLAGTIATMKWIHLIGLRGLITSVLWSLGVMAVIVAVRLVEGRPLPIESPYAILAASLIWAVILNMVAGILIALKPPRKNTGSV